MPVESGQSGRCGLALPKTRLLCFAYRVLRPLVEADPCLFTRTVLRCPMAVSLARRFLTSLIAWRCVANKLKRSSPTPTDQPSSVGSTTNIVVIVCLAMRTSSQNIGPPRQTHKRYVSLALGTGRCPPISSSEPELRET